MNKHTSIVREHTVSEVLFHIVLQAIFVIAIVTQTLLISSSIFFIAIAEQLVEIVAEVGLAVLDTVFGADIESLADVESLGVPKTPRDETSPSEHH